MLVRSEAFFFFASIQMQRKRLKKIASSDIYTLHIRSWSEISAVVEQQHQQNSLNLMAVILQALFKHTCKRFLVSLLRTLQ